MSHESREKKSSSNVVQIDSDDDEFEDASESFNVDDDYFVENVGTKRTEPLSKNYFSALSCKIVIMDGFSSG